MTSGAPASEGAPSGVGGTLLLVPTELERRLLADLGGLAGPDGAPLAPELVGFGAVAAAARTVALVLTSRPRRLVLVGIAGRYGPRPAAAETFGAVRVDGLGAGEGAQHLLPSALGFPQWQDAAGAVHDELALDGGGPTLLTVMAAARTGREVAARRARHPGAVGEDMEAFGVALAARLVGVPLTVVRGWSNDAGNREAGHWDVAGALAAARERTLAVLAEPVGPVPARTRPPLDGRPGENGP